MNIFTIDRMPDDVLPTIDELSGDMRIVAELVGVRMALTIAERFGGTPVMLYGHKKWLIRWRDQEIRAEYDRGDISGVALARKHGLCDRQVWNILGREPGEDRQLKLF
ncbi:Mor transcription activator family protein [Desulfocastanea catecholica]